MFIKRTENDHCESHLIVIDCVTGEGDSRPLRNESTIRERKVIHHQSSSRNWRRKEKLSVPDSSIEFST